MRSWGAPHSFFLILQRFKPVRHSQEHAHCVHACSRPGSGLHKQSEQLTENDVCDFPEAWTPTVKSKAACSPQKGLAGPNEAQPVRN